MCASTSVRPSTSDILSHLTPAQRIDLGIATEADLALQPPPYDPTLEEPQNLYPEEPLTDHWAIALQAAGYDSRANKVEVCGKFAHATFCDNHHFDALLIGYCGEQWMPCCRDRYAKLRVKSAQPIIDHIQEHHPQHNGKSVFVEIRMPSEMDADFALAQLDSLKTKIDQLREETVWFDEHDHQIHACPTWRRLCGILDGMLVLRVLLDDSYGNSMALIPPKHWKELFPEAKVTVHVDTEANFGHWFWRLWQPLKIDDPEACAWHVKAFHNRKLIRTDHKETVCLPILKVALELDAEEQIVDDNTVCADSSTSVDNKGDTPKVYPSCRHCGLPVKNKSAHLPVHSPELRTILERLHKHSES